MGEKQVRGRAVIGDGTPSMRNAAAWGSRDGARRTHRANL